MDFRRLHGPITTKVQAQLKDIFHGQVQLSEEDITSLEEQDAALDVVTFALAKPRVVDYRANPTSGGYRAVHAIVEINCCFAEIQIRTRAQNAWANLVERLDRLQGWDLKHGLGPADWLEWLQQVSDHVYRAQSGRPTGDFPPSPIDREEPA